MTQTRFKKVPFDIELAKKITKGEMKGRITTLDGREVRIVCWDKKPIEEYPIVVLATNDCGSEMLFTCTEEGLVINYPNYKSRYNLILEIPTYNEDYSNFVPQKFQPCLVRDRGECLWGVQVYSHSDCQDKMLFYDKEGYVIPFNYVLPLSKVTARLIGTCKSYEQLCEELDQTEKEL